MMRIATSHDSGGGHVVADRAPGGCPFDGMADAYCDGELSPLDRVRFQNHLDHCHDCAAQVERVRELSQWFEPARLMEPREDVLDRLHETVALRGNFEKRRRISDALPAARMLAALAASVLIVAGAWLFDGAKAPATPKTVPLRHSMAQAEPWERMALAMDDGAPDQERLLDWMVASLDKPEQP